MRLHAFIAHSKARAFSDICGSFNLARWRIHLNASMVDACRRSVIIQARHFLSQSVAIGETFLFSNAQRMFVLSAVRVSRDENFQGGAGLAIGSPKPSDESRI